MGRKPRFPPPIKVSKRGYASVTIRGDEIYLGKAGTPETKARYARIVAALTLNPDANVRAALSLADPTVAEVAASFLDAMRLERGPDWRELANFELSFRPLLALFGPSLAKEFGAQQLKAVQLAAATGSWRSAEEQLELRAAGKDPGWCRNVVNQRIGRIKAAWRWVESEGLVPKGSWENLRTVKALPRTHVLARNTPKREPSKLRDVLRVKRHCARPAVGVMLLLQWLCGMRSEEVRLMRTCDIDTSGAVWLYTPARHKMAYKGQERVVPIGPRAQKFLRPWLKPDRPEEFLFLPRCSEGWPYSDRGYAHAVNEACRRAGVKLVPYQGRHACAARIAKQEGLEAVRQVLGQRTLKMAAHYAGLHADHAADVMKRLG